MSSALQGKDCNLDCSSTWGGGEEEVHTYATPAEEPRLIYPLSYPDPVIEDGKGAGCILVPYHHSQHARLQISSCLVPVIHFWPIPAANYYQPWSKGG